MFLFWRVWHLRNDIIFGNGESLTSASVDFLQNYLTPMNPNSKFTAIGKGKAICYPEHAGSFLAAQNDKEEKVPCPPPPPDWIILNVDAGFDPHSGHAGFGFIAKNHVGEVLLSPWSSDQRCRSAEEAECIAAWVGLKHNLASWNGRLF